MKISVWWMFCVSVWTRTEPGLWTFTPLATETTTRSRSSYDHRQPLAIICLFIWKCTKGSEYSQCGVVLGDVTVGGAAATWEGYIPLLHPQMPLTARTPTTTTTASTTLCYTLSTPQWGAVLFGRSVMVVLAPYQHLYKLVNWDSARFSTGSSWWQESTVEVSAPWFCVSVRLKPVKNRNRFRCLSSENTKKAK